MDTSSFPSSWPVSLLNLTLRQCLFPESPRVPPETWPYREVSTGCNSFLRVWKPRDRNRGIWLEVDDDVSPLYRNLLHREKSTSVTTLSLSRLSTVDGCEDLGPPFLWCQDLPLRPDGWYRMGWVHQGFEIVSHRVSGPPEQLYVWGPEVGITKTR